MSAKKEQKTKKFCKEWILTDTKENKKLIATLKKQRKETRSDKDLTPWNLKVREVSEYYGSRKMPKGEVFRIASREYKGEATKAERPKRSLFELKGPALRDTVREEKKKLTVKMPANPKKR